MDSNNSPSKKMLHCIETARAALDDDRFGDAAMYARSAAQHEESLRIDVSRVERNAKEQRT